MTQACGVAGQQALPRFGRRTGGVARRAWTWQQCQQRMAAAPAARRSSVAAMLASALRLVANSAAGQSVAGPRSPQLSCAGVEPGTSTPPALRLRNIRQRARSQRLASVGGDSFRIESSFGTAGIADARRHASVPGHLSDSSHVPAAAPPATRELIGLAQSAAQDATQACATTVDKDTSPAQRPVGAGVSHWRKLSHGRISADASGAATPSAWGGSAPSAGPFRRQSVPRPWEGAAEQAALVAAAARAEATLRRSRRAERDVRSLRCKPFAACRRRAARNLLTPHWLTPMLPLCALAQAHSSAC